MSTLRIKRTSEYINRMRKIDVLVDGVKVGSVTNGQSIDFDIKHGEHKVVAEIDWCKSQEVSININENETKTLTLGSFRFGNNIFPYSLLIFPLHFILNRFLHFEYLIYLMYPFGIIMLYYFTIGRKHYLKLK